MAPSTLRDGSTTQDRRLDRLVEFDPASRRYGVVATIEHTYPRSMSYRCDVHLDQGQEGACTEFGCTHDLLARPVPVDVALCREIVRLHAIYWPAQRDDPWQGGSYPGASPRYEGTSVLAAVKRLQALGFITGYLWAFGIEQALLALSWKGPGVVGANWRDGCFDTDADGFIRYTGAVQGGHCLLVKGVRLVWQKGTTTAQKRAADWYSRLDLDKSYVVFHNSWGPDWGVGGDAKMTVRDFAALLADEGEFCIFEGRQKVNKIPLGA